MRIRIRGPAGQFPVTLDNDATIDTLCKTISAETKLSSFDVKYGYPPKILHLQNYDPSTKLTDLDVKLNGEQLIISQTAEVLLQKPTTPPTQTPNRASSTQGSTPRAGSSKESSQRPPMAISTESKPRSNVPSKAPLSLTRKENPEMEDPPEILLPDLGGTLLLRVMPDDNSCLFRAVANAIMPDLDTMTELRSIIAQTIQANPNKYTRAILDNKDPDKYCRWIQTEDAWGGQIELDILSQQFDIEIFCIDVQRLRVDKYNEGASRRCFLVYSGIHYDTIALNIFGMPPEEDIKQFEAPIADEVLPQAIALCQKLKDKHYYTDTAAFTLKCGDCGAVCVGESGATEHAKQTGHYNFGEAS